MSENYDEVHVAEFRGDGWSLQHPLSCRPNLLDCEVHAAIQEEVAATGGPPVELDRYVVELGENGLTYRLEDFD